MTLPEKIAVATSFLAALSELLAAIPTTILRANSLWQLIRDLCRGKLKELPKDE